ncbi:MAG: family 20 glycosylhydrolase, partial [Bacteroidota bacterium]
GILISKLKEGFKQAEDYYDLVIDDKSSSVQITGSSPRGIFYGIQHLLHNWIPTANKKEMKFLSYTDPLPRLSFKSPMAYRGLHLDVARNFQKKESVLKLLDLMAYNRLNKLHLHLTEDEGWRIEIDAFPELTEIGAYRKHGKKDDNVVHPAYGSGAFGDPETSWGSGFYTKEDFKEILTYAKERYIDVIPEVNFPGHARAAIKSMNARRERLLKEGKNEEADKYWLIDADDTSEYISAQRYDDNVTCVCKESVYDFYEIVLDEIIEMYKEVDANLEIVHTGGDEIPKGAWEGSPICKDFLKQHPEVKDAPDLNNYFHRRLAKMFADRNLQLAGWEEIAMNPGGKVNPEFVKDNFLPYVWNSLWGAQDLGNRMANAGYPVILCNVTNLYFDLAYNNDPEEPGLYWAGFVDTKDAFDFDPFDILSSTKEDPFGKKFDPKTDFRGMQRLLPKAKENIIGIQGQLWAETVEGPDMMEYYLLPKLFGLAHVAWPLKYPEYSFTQKGLGRILKMPKVDWNLMASNIGYMEFPILDELHGGYNYRIPRPGAMIQNDSLFANMSYPGFTLRYSTDGDEPTADSPIYNEPKPISAEGKVGVRAFNRLGRGGRTAWVEKK